MITDVQEFDQGVKKCNSLQRWPSSQERSNPPLQGRSGGLNATFPQPAANKLEEQHIHSSKYPKPCLRVRSESDAQAQNPSKGQNLSIRWLDISGCGELVEVHEYEPSESEYSGDYGADKPCCSIM